MPNKPVLPLEPFQIWGLNFIGPFTPAATHTCVEIQAQHRPDRLKKPRSESVGTDPIGRFCAENRDDATKDIPLGIYFAVSVGALKEH